MGASELGPSRESLELNALQTAETVAEMVLGGCPFYMAIEICRNRAPDILQGWVLNLAAQKAKEKLSLQNVYVEESKDLEVEMFNPNTVRNGDLVDFGGQGKFYVLETKHSPSYFWVSPSKSDRFLSDSKGFPIYKNFALGIIERVKRTKIAA